MDEEISSGCCLRDHTRTVLTFLGCPRSPRTLLLQAQGVGSKTHKLVLQKGSKCGWKSREIPIPISSHPHTPLGWREVLEALPDSPLQPRGLCGSCSHPWMNTAIKEMKFKSCFFPPIRSHGWLGTVHSTLTRVTWLLIEIFLPKWSNVNILVIFTYFPTSSALFQTHISIHWASYFLPYYFS